MLALPNMLDRIPGNPSQAIDVLSSKDIPQAERGKAMNLLITSSDFKKVEGKHTLVLPQPPRFFKALALQPDEVVDRVYSFWRQLDGSASSAKDPSRRLVSVGKKLEAIVALGYRTKAHEEEKPVADSRIIDGYKIGKYEFYLLKSGALSADQG
jgi:hypothetical protein